MKFKRKSNGYASARQDRLAHHIAGSIIRKQQQLSYVISVKICSLPLSFLKWILLVFCLVGSGLSVYLVATSLKSNKKAPTPIGIDHPLSPAHFNSGMNELLQQSIPVDSMQLLESIYLQQHKK